MHCTVIAAALAALAVALAPGSASAAVPNGFVGITSEDLLRNSPGYQASTLAAQHRAGVRLIRQTFDWTEIEDTPGVYKWSLYDRLVLATARARISLLPGLFNTPGFHSSRPEGSQATFPPRNPLSMADFAEAAVARYGPGGTLWSENPSVPARPIKAWQIWNEPSLRAYWGPKPNAREYVTLLKAVNDAIKRVDRGAEVVTAGIPPSVIGGAVPIVKYITDMYKAGGKNAFDTLAVNAYARSAGELDKRLRTIRKLMNRRGDRGARIWITEVGWCDRGVRHRFCVGSRKQTSLVKKSLDVIRKDRKSMRLRGFVYYTWRDGAPYAPSFRDQWGLHTGLLKLNGRPKPALRAFSRAARRFR